jgi:hypothetical protein
MASLFKTQKKEAKQLNQSNQYDIKDKNNEDILIIFKNNSIINNSEIHKEIPMTDFVNKINTIASSTNVVDISKSINLISPYLMSYSAIEANKYKSILRGDNLDFIYKYMINKINCNINPMINNKMRQSIAIVKWKIYTFMTLKEEEETKTKSKNVEFDISVAYWIAMLSGIYLYFDEKDELNFKQSSLLSEISKPFNVNSFK